MALRQAILDLLYDDEPEGASFGVIFQRWREIEPEVDLFTAAFRERLARLLELMIERDDLARARWEWYQLTASKWLRMTRSRQRSLTSSTGT